MNIRTLLPGVALALGLCAPALAKDDVFVSGDLHLNAGIEAGAFFGVAKNTNFGGGRVDLRTGKNTGDTQYGETYLEPSISFTYGAGKAFGLFGEASAVLTSTLGEGDAGGFTPTGPTAISTSRRPIWAFAPPSTGRAAPLGRWSCRAANRTSRSVTVS